MGGGGWWTHTTGTHTAAYSAILPTTTHPGQLLLYKINEHSVCIFTHCFALRYSKQP